MNIPRLKKIGYLVLAEQRLTENQTAKDPSPMQSPQGTPQCESRETRIPETHLNLGVNRRLDSAEILRAGGESPPAPPGWPSGSHRFPLERFEAVVRFCGKARLLAPAVSAIARRFAQAAFFSTADYVAKNKATVAAFRKVIEEGSAYANAHHAQMIPLIAKFTGIEEKVIAAEPQQLVGTSLDVRLIQPLVDTAAKYGAIPGSFDARAMIDPGAVS